MEQEPTKEELIALLLKIRDIWVPRLEDTAIEADKTHCNARGIFFDIIKVLPRYKYPKGGSK